MSCIFKEGILNISFNQLTSLPEIKIPYSEIIQLNISYNSFVEIPDIIFKMTNLESLIISNCKITKIPKDISKLKKLKYLSLMTNNIKEIPDEILDLHELQYLYLAFNPITKMPTNFDKHKYNLYTYGEGQRFINSQINIKKGIYIDGVYLPSYDEIDSYNTRTIINPPSYM